MIHGNIRWEGRVVSAQGAVVAPGSGRVRPSDTKGHVLPAAETRLRSGWAPGRGRREKGLGSAEGFPEPPAASLPLTKSGPPLWAGHCSKDPGRVGLWGGAEFGVPCRRVASRGRPGPHRRSPF